MTLGMGLAAGGLIYFAQISPHGTYLGTLLPGFLLAGVGLGLSFVPVTIGAMSGVARRGGCRIGTDHHDATDRRRPRGRGVSTIVVSATTRFTERHGHAPVVMTNAVNYGFSVAFWFGAVFAGIGRLIAFFGMGKHSSDRDPASGPAIEERPNKVQPVSP